MLLDYSITRRVNRQPWRSAGISEDIEGPMHPTWAHLGCKLLKLIWFDLLHGSLQMLQGPLASAIS